MPNRKEREEFIVNFARAFPDIKPETLTSAATALLRLAKRHGQIAVAQCNGDLEQHVIEREYLKVAEGLQKIARDVPGLKIETGGDPRGYTVKLHLPNGAYNTWGGKESGYGVPQ